VQAAGRGRRIIADRVRNDTKDKYGSRDERDLEFTTDTTNRARGSTAPSID